jgi:hypothetical protein
MPPCAKPQESSLLSDMGTRDGGDSVVVSMRAPVTNGRWVMVRSLSSALSRCTWPGMGRPGCRLEA